MAYAEDEPEEESRNRLMFFGANLAEIPCFRNSYMYGIGAGAVSGVVYNLALSRNPMKMAFATYGLVTFGYYFQCRYKYRTSEMEMKKIKHGMQRMAYLEGTQADEEWARTACLNDSEVRNFRSDAGKSEEEVEEAWHKEGR